MNFKTEFIDKNLLPIVLELNRVFPDGLVVMTGLYALLTLSFPFAVMFGSLLEATALFHLLKFGFSYLHVADVTTLRTVANPLCRTGFSSVDLGALSMFSAEPRQAFPSASLYILSVAAAYVFSTINAQAKELEALGPAYSSRFYVSMMFLLVLIFLFSIFRLAFSCDTFGVVIGTIPVGIIVGLTLVMQNRNLFGASSVNLLGIPLLRNRAASGKKLYVCPTRSKK